MSFNPVPTLRKEPMGLKPWTKPDGTQRFKGASPPWYCPKCLQPFRGPGVKNHREMCGKEAGK